MITNKIKTIDETLQTWLKELDEFLEENQDVKDEKWFRTLLEIKYQVNKCLVELG